MNAQIQTIFHPRQDFVAQIQIVTTRWQVITAPVNLDTKIGKKSQVNIN